MDVSFVYAWGHANAYAYAYAYAASSQGGEKGTWPRLADHVYMSNPFAHAHNAHKLLDRMLADYQQRSAYARAASVRATAWGGHTRKDGVRLASSRARNAKKSAASSGVIRPATSSRFHFPSLPFPVAPFHNYIMFVNILL